LLGADVLACFDQMIDLPGGRLTLDSGELEHPGHAIELEEFMGIPFIPVTVAGWTRWRFPATRHSFAVRTNCEFQRRFQSPSTPMATSGPRLR